MENTGATLALSVSDFCRAHGISRNTFYRLLAAGTGPKVMAVGRRKLVSIEAAAAWRVEREQA